MALYLQKYIVYRKRKISFADGSFTNLIELLIKHKEEKFLLTLSEPHKPDLPETMAKLKFSFHPVILARTVAADGLARHGDLALLDGDEGLDAQHPARDSHSGGQTAALAQVLQVVDDGHEVQVLLGVLQNGRDLPGALAGIPQVDGQTDQQRLAEADVLAVHEEDVVRVDHVGGELGALVGAGQLVGQEDADHLVPGGGRFGEEVLEQLRAGLAGGGELVTPGEDAVIFGGGHVHAVAQDGAVLQSDVQRDDGHAQLLGFGGQDVGRRIGENTDHKIPPDFR